MIVNDIATGKEAKVEPFGPNTAIAVRRERMEEEIGKAPYPSYESYTRGCSGGVVVQHDVEGVRQ